MVDQNSPSQFFILLAIYFLATSLIYYLTYRYSMRKYGDRRRAGLMAKLASAIPMSIILGLGFGWSPLIILLFMVGSVVFAFIHTYAIWRTRKALYGKESWVKKPPAENIDKGRHTEEKLNGEKK